MDDCRQELWDLMAQEHGKYLLDTELWDIITLVERGMRADLDKLVDKWPESIPTDELEQLITGLERDR